MRKDKIYWLYTTKVLLEEYQSLTEAERNFKSYNLHYHIANSMAHSGESVESIHAHLSNEIDPAYHASAYRQWYEYGGESPVGAYLRNIAKHNFHMHGLVQHPKINDIDVHHSLIHPEAINIINRIHKIANEVHSTKLPESVTIYRGIGISDNNKQYIPHALESWTTDIHTAQKFSKMSHLSDVVPHVLRATVHRDHILLSHLMKPSLPFIPSDSELVGKEEIIPLGHKLKNIERIL